MVGLSPPAARRQMAPDGEERRRPGGHAAILRDLDRMDRRAGRDLVHLSEVKGKGCCAGDERRHRLPREVVELHPWRCATASGHLHSHMLMQPAAPLPEKLPVSELLRHTGDIPRPHPPRHCPRHSLCPSTAAPLLSKLSHHSSLNPDTPPYCDKPRGSSWKGTFGPQYLSYGTGGDHSLFLGKPEL